MHRYQLLCLFSILFIIGIDGKGAISYFNAIDPSKPDDRSAISATNVKLWANIVDCNQENSCASSVHIDGLDDEMTPWEKVEKENETLLTTTFVNLIPNTAYKFILTCKDTSEMISKELQITTDYGRPSDSIESVNVTFDYPIIRIEWSSPSISIDSFTEYRIFIDNKDSFVSTKSNTSFQISNKYIDSKSHTVSIAVCYVNNQNATLCSSKNKAEKSFSFSIPTTTTTAPPTSPSTTSNGIYSYSISICVFLFSLINIFLI